MGYKTITVKPISGALSAAIEGVDLPKELSNETFDDIHQAFLDHVVIFFRAQLSPPYGTCDGGRRAAFLTPARRAD